jgi:hypothetical protein
MGLPEPVDLERSYCSWQAEALLKRKSSRTLPRSLSPSESTL